MLRQIHHNIEFAVGLVERRRFSHVLQLIARQSTEHRAQWVAQLYRHLDRRRKILPRCEGRWIFAQELVLNGYDVEFFGYVARIPRIERRRDWVIGLLRRASRGGFLRMLQKLHSWDLATAIVEPRDLRSVLELHDASSKPLVPPHVAAFLNTWLLELDPPVNDESDAEDTTEDEDDA